MKPTANKWFANPFWLSVWLLGLIAVRACMAASGFEYANLLYAVIPVFIVMLAHTGGMLLVVGASCVAVLADSFATALALNQSLALVLSLNPSGSAGTVVGPVEKFMLLVSIGAAVSIISSRWSSAFSKESRRAEDYLKKLYMQQKESACAISDAKSHMRRVRQDVDMYSSLVLLLEEAAEKIYSHLNPEELIETFFLVLRKCLNADTGCIYFIDDSQGEAARKFTLHAKFGYSSDVPFDQPDILPVGDPLVEYVMRSPRAIALFDPSADGTKAAMTADTELADIAAGSRLNVVMATALMEQNEITGIVTINSFHDDSLLDEKRDTSLLSMLSNITSIAFTNARLFMKIRDMADRDTLTKLFNRGYFYNELSRELSKQRLEGGSLCVLLFDIDHFKPVNDTYGHQAGDAVLTSFAELCRSTVRDCDVLARYGGEEFIVLLPGLIVEEGRHAAERIRRAVEAQEFPVEHANGSLLLQVTVSCGVAAFPDHASDVASLTKAADCALYEAKEAGRNRIVVAGCPTSETSADADSLMTQDESAQTSEPGQPLPAAEKPQASRNSGHLEV